MNYASKYQHFTPNDKNHLLIKNNEFYVDSWQLPIIVIEKPESVKRHEFST